MNAQLNAREKDMKIKHLLLIILILSTLTLLFSCVGNQNIGTNQGGEPKQYVVTFDADGGTSVEAQVVEENKKVTAPSDPTKEGYTFSGWYVGDEKWSFISHTVTGNITLKAKWEAKTHTVTFDANGGEGGKTETVKHGDTVSAPLPSRPNYSFEGWYVGETKWNFKTDKITSDITLVAKWEPFTKTITFNANGGTVSETTRKVKYGEAIGTLPVPVYENQEFLGWYISGDTETQITEDYIVTDKITLVAKWGEPPKTVIFDANGGTVSETSRKVRPGEMIGTLPTPNRAGFKFVGWFDEEDTNFEVKISASKLVIFDTVLVAKWERDENAVSVEFDPNGGIIDDVDVVRYLQKGDNIGKLPTPTREGYVFVCWTLEDGTTVARQTTVINTNTVCIAKWERIVYCMDGTENHAWSIWQEESQATCETAQIDVRVCAICGYTEYKEGTPALGHDWSNWFEEYMKKARTCYECHKMEIQNFKNVTIEALGPRNYPTIEGEVWGKDKVGNLINGMFEPSNEGAIVGKGSSPVTVTLDLANPTSVDIIYVKGRGSSSIEVSVTFEDGSQKFLGIGSFGDDPSSFEVEGKVITKVVIVMPNPSNGEDFWQEITLAQKA